MKMHSKLDELMAHGVIVPFPHRVSVAEDVPVENVERGVVLQPGVTLEGKETLLGSGSILGPGGHFKNVRCGRQVRLSTGVYDECVFLDHSEARSGAEIRGGSLFMEYARSAHTVGCKMTVLGIRVTLGSLINYCDIFISGGNDEPFGFTEIGSGAVHYNFTPNGLKFGSLIGAGAPGEMFGLFPKSFIGGQTQLIAPLTVGTQVLVPAGVSVRKSVKNGVLYVEPPLSPSEKPYYTDMITSAVEKFRITARLIAHYQVLSFYFETVRKAYARQRKDLFLERLTGEAVKMIDSNVRERWAWLFCKKEGEASAEFFSRLPRSLELHRQEKEASAGEKTAFFQKQVLEHERLLAHQERLNEIVKSPVPADGLSEFLPLWQSHIEREMEDHCTAIRTLPLESKQVGAKCLNDLVERKLEQIDQAICD